MITINGTAYDVGVTKISRTAQIFEGPNAGFALDHTKILDVIGTGWKYEVTMEVHGMGVTDYDNLYEALIDPTSLPHAVALPYGQTTKTFTYYTAEINDTLVSIIDNQRWGALTLEFNEMTPGRSA